MSVSKKIQVTKNYALFHKSDGNRPLDVKKHKKLIDSMKLYGFLKCFPIVVSRDRDGKLVVKDGQHRLAIAETLGLSVYWVEDDTNFDVAVVNCAAKGWCLRDYAQMHAANGKKQYETGLEFASEHGLPIGTAFALLAGTTSFGNCQSDFIDGVFQIKDRQWADAVAGLYVAVTGLAPDLRKQTFIEACMAVCRVATFDPKRLIAGAEKCRAKLINYGTRDAFLDMMEEVYNYGKKQLVPLKINAIQVMRERHIIGSKNKTKKQDAA